MLQGFFLVIHVTFSGLVKQLEDVVKEPIRTLEWVLM